MNPGDYVRVDTKRGSYTGTVLSTSKSTIFVECKCCFAPRACRPEEVRLA